VRLGRVIEPLLAGGASLLAAGLAFFALPANAAAPYDRDGALQPFEYTRHASRVSSGRPLYMYVDRDFDENERQHVVSAIRQWNYVLNGLVRIEARMLPDNVTTNDIAKIKRAGGWIVAKVDSRHPVAHRGEGERALAVTTGGNNGGFVYVISDRIGGRDLTGVIMHEFGHVLGAGHDQVGLMAPVYNATAARCIDFDAANLVAQSQRISVRDMNWCQGPGRSPGPMNGERYRSGAALNGWQ
jgi:hypothetical protein